MEPLCHVVFPQLAGLCLGWSRLAKSGRGVPFPLHHPALSQYPASYSLELPSFLLHWELGVARGTEAPCHADPSQPPPQDLSQQAGGGPVWQGGSLPPPIPSSQCSGKLGSSELQLSEGWVGWQGTEPPCHAYLARPPPESEPASWGELVQQRGSVPIPLPSSFQY